MPCTYENLIINFINVWIKSNVVNELNHDDDVALGTF